MDFPSITPRAVLGTSIFVVLFLYLLKYVLSGFRRPNFPVVPASLTDYRSAMVEGNRKYPNTPFIIDDLLILPASTIDEVRNLPETRASLLELIARELYPKHTGLIVDRKDIIKAIKLDLTRHNTSNFESLRDEIQYALDKELGACKDWSPICVVSKLTSIIALLSGRVFVGLPLSRNKEWIDATVNYTKDIVIAREAIIRQPAIIRDFVAPFLPEVKSVKRSNKRSAALLEPLVKEVLTRETDEKYGNEEDKKGTMVSWMLQYSDDKSVETLVNNQMTLSFTAIFTTASAASQVIFDLVCRPKYMQHLRDEIRQVIDEDGYDDSGLTRKIKRQSIPKLQKLDSFIKESQRLSPFSLVSMDRITMAPLKLSTGHTIPKGVHVAFPAYTIGLSAASFDLESAPLDEFDGFRFYKLRTAEGSGTSHQFVTISHDSLHFGHGAHACPGRFFASDEIKLIVIELLQNWDMRLLGDVHGYGGVDKRPESRPFKTLYAPNESAQVEFRKREES